jgi:hypothetical protein
MGEARIAYGSSARCIQRLKIADQHQPRPRPRHCHIHPSRLDDETALFGQSQRYERDHDNISFDTLASVNRSHRHGCSEVANQHSDLCRIRRDDKHSII